MIKKVLTVVRILIRNSVLRRKNMGRAPCCDKNNVKRGPWSPEEDSTLKSYIEQHGTGGNWIALPQKIGLKRCGKSCRLRWLNYLRPNIKHGGFSEEEERTICSLYMNIGSRWSIIAAQLPGRTDNDIKNYWNTRLKKKLLGKQRKEQQQARRANFLRQQEAKKEENFGNFVTPNINDPLLSQIPYWPTMVPNSLVMPSTTNTNFQYPIDDISYIQEQLSAHSMFKAQEIENNYYDVNNPNLYDVGLSELDELLYGLESLGSEMINGAASSSESATSYPPMLRMHSTVFEQAEEFIQNPTFDESRYYVGWQ